MVVYSHSRLSCFEQCPHKFKLKYLDKIKVEIEESIEGFLGGQVHSVLEWLYKQVAMGSVPSLNSVFEYYEDEWKNKIPEKINIVRKEFGVRDYFNKGKIFLKNYYEKHYPFEEDTIAIEKRILVDLDGSGKYKLQGFIDRLVYNDGAYEVHDYKTGNSLKSQQELDQDRQLALYSIGVKKLFSDAEKICLTWHFLAHNKTFCSYRTDEELEVLKQEIIKLIDEIESAKEFPALKSALCSWCEFKPHCPKFKHLYQENEEEVHFENDGNRLVNKYAELYAKKKEFVEEIDMKIGALREAILFYAKANNLDVLFGDSNRLMIKGVKKFKFPSKSSAERKKLDFLLKELDKWNEVTTLDTFALNRALKEGKWDKEVLDKIGEFSEFVEDFMLRLGKKD